MRRHRIRRRQAGVGLFLGPAPFEGYHPGITRSTGAAGPTWAVGAIGDMGAHLIDSPVLGAGTRHPDDDRDCCRRRTTAPGTPSATTTYYEFPARGAKAGREADVVRRRPAAGQAGGTRRRGSWTEGGGVLYVGTQGQADSRDVRLRSRDCSRCRCSPTPREPPQTFPADPLLVARDELDRHDSRPPGGFVAVLLRRSG